MTHSRRLAILTASIPTAILSLACGGLFDRDRDAELAQTGGTSSGGQSSGGTSNAGTSSGGVGGSGATGSGGSAAGAGGSGAASCLLEGPAIPPPYPTTFRLVNRGPEVFYGSGCWSTLRVKDCMGEPLDTAAFCMLECNAVSPEDGCVACSAPDCRGLNWSVASGAAAEEQWEGNLFDYVEYGQGCSCAVITPALPGRYKVSVSLFATQADADTGSASHTVEKDFILPADDGVVEIDVTPP
jgi:hypothetical protein